MAKTSKKVEGELTQKEKEMNELVASMEKEYGKGSIIKASNGVEPYGDVVPVSSIALSQATGIGGFPKNKIVEIIGWESSGKSTLSGDIIGHAQKKYGDECLLIDKENSFDPFYASSLGVDLEKLRLTYPESLEDNYDVIEKALDSKLFGVIVIDSLTSFEPKAKQGEKRGSGLGGEARINSDRMRMVNNKIRNSNCCVIFINQIREKLGVMFGSPETTSGGNALKFYAHLRIMIRKKEIDAENESNIMTFQIIKNKMAPPMRKAEMTIVWGKGFDIDKEIIDYALEFGFLIKRNASDPLKSGNTWFYGDMKLESSEDKAIQMIKDNPEMLEEIKQKVLNKLNESDEPILPSIEEESGEIKIEEIKNDTPNTEISTEE